VIEEIEDRKAKGLSGEALAKLVAQMEDFSACTLTGSTACL
jgi:hypothetical protein